MPNSRQKILNYLTEQQTATAEDLSRIFRVTQANIRHHLAVLRKQGTIKVIGTQSLAKRGRPTQVYAASSQVDLNNLVRLSDTLLHALVQNSGLDGENLSISNVALRLGSNFIVDQANPTKRLYSTIHALNQMNYQAHWEAHVDNPRIMLGHCPYQAIIEKHPELCSMDGYLLEHLIGVPIIQVEKLVKNEKGLPECTFIINRFT